MINRFLVAQMRNRSLRSKGFGLEMEKVDQPMEEFDDNEGFEELTENWVGLVTKEDFLEHTRNQEKMFIEQETRSRGAEPFSGMKDHAPTSKGGGECAQQKRGAVLSCSRGSGLSDHAPTSPGGGECAQ